MEEVSDFGYEMDHDDQIDDRKHQKLVRNVLSLNKPKKPQQLTSRTEPTIHRSEFNLVTSIAGSKGGVEISDLTKALTGRKNRVKIKEKLKKASKVKTLPKPLEKPQADRIQRVLGYEKSRLEVDKWEPIIDANRASVNLSFPLDNDTKMDKKMELMNCDMWRLKSKIEEELEKVLPKVEEYHIGLEEKEEGVKLTMKEMLEKRKESAKLRVRQSYLESKARQKKKIKSKKYHRILKREKMKQKLNEFEGLLKTDPEEALRQWDEKARIEERFTLRHKSTGKWARSKQFRAKYDKESRQDLAEQLKISKDLTKKTKSNESSDEDGEDDEEEEKRPSPRIAQKIDENNPWEAGIKPNKDVEQFVTNYRKFWTEHNENLTKTIEENEEQVNGNTDNCEDNSEEVMKQKRKLESSDDEAEEETPVTQKIAEHVAKEEKSTKGEKKEATRNKKAEKRAKNKKVKLDCESTSEWDVSISDKTGEELVGEMFDKLENKMRKKKLKKANKLLEQKSKQQKKTVEKKAKEKNALKVVKLASDLRNNVVRPVIDEALIEETNNEPSESGTENVQALSKLLTVEDDVAEKPTQISIDPNKFERMVKSTKLTTSMPDVLTVGEDEDEPVDQSKLIAEALEDDDIVEEFNRTKKDEQDKDKPKVEDNGLPGWGSWTGPDIKPKPKRRKPKFTVKITRKDDNKGFLIINEKSNDKGIRDHMVSEVPFPFKTVKDFEASIRAPITREFVTENAFKKFIKPAVTTKMGAIIEPMSKDILMKK